MLDRTGCVRGGVKEGLGWDRTEALRAPCTRALLIAVSVHTRKGARIAFHGAPRPPQSCSKRGSVLPFESPLWIATYLGLGDFGAIGAAEVHPRWNKTAARTTRAHNCESTAWIRSPGPIITGEKVVPKGRRQSYSR